MFPSMCFFFFYQGYNLAIHMDSLTHHPSTHLVWDNIVFLYKVRQSFPNKNSRLDAPFTVY